MEQYCTHTFRKIISTHNWKNNSPIRTYWLSCKTCGHRWKVHFDRSLKREVVLSKDSANRPLNHKKLIAEEVRLILTDMRSNSEIARELGVSHQSVHQVRVGMTHRDVHPELPRNIPRPQAKRKRIDDSSSISCRDCVHWWQGGCGLEVPEAGGAFATECSYFGAED